MHEYIFYLFTLQLQKKKTNFYIQVSTGSDVVYICRYIAWIGAGNDYIKLEIHKIIFFAHQNLFTFTESEPNLAQYEKALIPETSDILYDNTKYSKYKNSEYYANKYL